MNFILKKYNQVQKEIFMKTKFIQCLVLSALAIGITSNAMARKNDKPEPICDNSTLKGLYHYALDAPNLVVAGKFTFDGEGGGVLTYTAHYKDQTKVEPVNESSPFTYFTDPTVDCKYTLTGFTAGQDKQLYTNLNGDSASVITKGGSISGIPVANEIMRGPKHPYYD